MKVTVLGCGASAGVPTILNDWGACEPHNPKNKRSRTSILIETEHTTILVDTSPDMREQLLKAKVRKIDAVIYTHEHADHTQGIDDLKPFFYQNNHTPIPVYGQKRCLDELKDRFGFLFGTKTGPATPADFKPVLNAREVDEKSFEINNLTITPFYMDHGRIQTMGIRIGDFAYSTDVVRLDEQAFQNLEGTKTWIVDCLRYTPSHSHSHLPQTLSWIERVNPQQAYLTQMSKDLDYDTLCHMLPPHIRPAYDGLVLDIQIMPSPILRK